MMKYALYRNHLTEGENDFSAIPLSQINKKIEDVIVQITKPGSILKQTECVVVIHGFFRAISENLIIYQRPFKKSKEAGLSIISGMPKP